MDPAGSRKLYFNKNQAKTIEKFSAEDIVTLIQEGRDLFSLTMSNAEDSEINFLESHPKLKEVIEKW